MNHPNSHSNLCEGVYPAVLTPMRPDYSCDLPELAAHCQDLLQRGCGGVTLFGTTGEGPSFTVAERIAALEGLIASGLNPKKIIVSVSCSAFMGAAELIRAAAKHKCSAVLIVPPFFYKNVSDRGVITYYRELLRLANAPHIEVLLYHIPQYSGVPITLEVIDALLKEFPTQIVGLKESEGNLPLVKSIVERFPHFKVYLGSENLLSEGVRLGAAGAIAGIPNAFPELLCALYAYGKDEKMPNRQAEIETVKKALTTFAFIPSIKSVIKSRRGSAWETLRPPLLPLTPMESQIVSQALDKL